MITSSPSDDMRIVFSHPAIQMAVRTALESAARFKVIGEAQCGAQGAAMVRELKPDLTICGIELATLNGLLLTERIRAQQPETRVLIFSAQDESIFAVRAMRAGAHGFVSKRWHMDRLLDAACTVMRGTCVFPTELQDQWPSRRAAQKDPVERLSDRELTVARHLVSGLNNKEIGQRLFLSNKTVSGYKARLFAKLNISTIVQLIDFVRARGLA